MITETLSSCVSPVFGNFDLVRGISPKLFRVRGVIPQPLSKERWGLPTTTLSRALELTAKTFRSRTLVDRAAPSTLTWSTRTPAPRTRRGRRSRPLPVGLWRTRRAA